MGQSIAKKLFLLGLIASPGCVTPSTPDAQDAAAVESVDPETLPPTAYHTVDGWPGWVCADLPDGKRSQWYTTDQGVDSAAVWDGPCAAWKESAANDNQIDDATRPTDREAGEELGGTDLEPGDIKEYHVILGWPGWRCADYKDGREKSVWFFTEQGADTAATWKGNCDSWAR